MPTLLHLDASPRRERSRSRQLAQQFLAIWSGLHPETQVVYRDLGQEAIPHITETWIAADFTPPADYTPEMATEIQLSDQLVDEFLAADYCLFSVPMYNFSIPSNFKAYIDQIVRINRTFAIQDGAFKGLVADKKVLFITTRGATYGVDSPFATWDCQEPALRCAFQFMGVSSIEFVHASGLDMGDAAQQQGLNQAEVQLQQLAAVW